MTLQFIVQRLGHHGAPHRITLRLFFGLQLRVLAETDEHIEAGCGLTGNHFDVIRGFIRLDLRGDHGDLARHPKGKAARDPGPVAVEKHQRGDDLDQKNRRHQNEQRSRKQRLWQKTLDRNDAVAGE